MARRFVTLTCEICSKKFAARAHRKSVHCRECAEELRRGGRGPVQVRDAEVAKQFQRILTRQGMTFQLKSKVTGVAANPAGGGAEGIGLGVGLAMAQKMTEAMGPGGGAQTPPPLPDSAFFAALGGKQAGPFTLEEVETHVREGTITRRTLVWTRALDDWTPAAQVPALAEVFALVPPPLPPADAGA